MPDPVTRMIWYTIHTQAGRNCPYCTKAAELLDTKGAAYHMRPLAIEKLREVAGRANMTTVPIIYHGVHLVGGYDDLIEYLKEEEAR